MLRRCHPEETLAENRVPGWPCPACGSCRAVTVTGARPWASLAISSAGLARAGEPSPRGLAWEGQGGQRASPLLIPALLLRSAWPTFTCNTAHGPYLPWELPGPLLQASFSLRAPLPSTLATGNRLAPCHNIPGVEKFQSSLIACVSFWLAGRSPANRVFLLVSLGSFV